MHDEFIRRGDESPYARWFEGGFPDSDHRFTTFVDVGDFLHHRRAGLLAHRTQVDPDGHWMRLPDDVIREIFPWDEYVLARSLVGMPPDGETDDDHDRGDASGEVPEPGVAGREPRAREGPAGARRSLGEDAVRRERRPGR
jgi:hypothetical protein